MDIESFKLVVQYTVESTLRKLQFTPHADVIVAMQRYHTYRARAAKDIAQNIANDEFIKALRTSNCICQYNACPSDSRCCISNERMNSSDGKTIVAKINGTDHIYCMHQRFVSNVHKYYNIVHFDKEIYKVFTEWHSRRYHRPNIPDNTAVEALCETFLSYSDSSRLNQLYIKFNSICDF